WLFVHVFFFFCFFFSSRRRHTRWPRDWSSDVCSSDLSTDGGSTWKRLEGHGLPSGVLGRIGVAVSGADSKRVYAMVEAKENAIYRSNDGGQTWQMTNNEPLWVRPWYGNHIYADPENADTVYVLDLNTMRSTDGGHEFQALPVPHSD